MPPLEVGDKVLKKAMKSTQHIGGKLEPKQLFPYTMVDIKESGWCIIKDKYFSVKKTVIHIDQIKLYFNKAVRPGNKEKWWRTL